MGKSSQYGVILDAGSSGTRVYVYKWKNPAQAAQHATASELSQLPELKLKESKKIHPGVSTFAEDVASVGRDHLKTLVNTALDHVPHDKVAETPIFLMATAGVRFLPKQQQTALLDGICTYLRANTDFHLPDCNDHIQVISGETEGLYGWLAANYLLGGFDLPQELSEGKDGHHTYGFLDMGGASAQIAFAPNATEAEKHSEDLKLVRLRRLNGQAAEYRVFTATWLGFGANKARERYVDILRSSYADDLHEIPDPCLPDGLRTTLDGQPLLQGKSSKDQILTGTGKFDECLRQTYPLLRKDAPCYDQPCLLDGQHVPGIDFDINRFIGVSEYWHTTHGVFGKDKKKAYDLATYQENVRNFCSQQWSEIEGDLHKRKKSAEEKAQEAREACFKASWVINVLYDGIGIPRVGLDDMGNSDVNATNELVESAQSKGIADAFRPVDDIDGVELSWTLGKMVLYAAGQVRPEGSALPVGFGSNLKSGVPSDFQAAGSSPLSPLGDFSDDDDDDLEDIMKAHSKSGSGFFVLIVLLLVVAFLLRKPERRQRILHSLTIRRRKAGGRKLSRVFPFTSSIFRRGTPNYERVIEEGDAAAFELDDVDSSDENESSDGNGGARVDRFLGTNNSKTNTERAGGIVPLSIDRHGHVIRTESCERLAAPTVQMLNAGRRSRTGSPTRHRVP